MRSSDLRKVAEGQSGYEISFELRISEYTGGKSELHTALLWQFAFIGRYTLNRGWTVDPSCRAPASVDPRCEACARTTGLSIHSQE